MKETKNESFMEKMYNLKNLFALRYSPCDYYTIKRSLCNKVDILITYDRGHQDFVQIRFFMDYSYFIRTGPLCTTVEYIPHVSDNVRPISIFSNNACGEWIDNPCSNSVERMCLLYQRLNTLYRGDSRDLLDGFALELI